MAAPVAAPGRALLRAGAERLLPGGVRNLLRPWLEGGTPGPGRDFCLSHSRVRLRGAVYTRSRVWGRVGARGGAWGREGPGVAGSPGAGRVGEAGVTR